MTAAPWLALIGVNVVLAWYVRRRLQATRRRRLVAASAASDDGDRGRARSRPTSRHHFVE
jgi:hypothetical protein